MSHSEEQDRLVDMLLRMKLSGKRPPNLADKILRRARPASPFRRWLVPAAAACLFLSLVFIAAALLWPRHAVVPFSPARGEVVSSQAEPKSLVLGGYCRITLDPGSTVTVEGSEKAELVFLTLGRILCDVDHGVGQFKVRTEVGEVAVTGTQFSVQLEEGDNSMVGKRMFVKVLAGAVLVSGSWGSLTLAAGEETTVPKAAAVTTTTQPETVVVVPTIPDKPMAAGVAVQSEPKAPAAKAETAVAPEEVVIVVPPPSKPVAGVAISYTPVTGVVTAKDTSWVEVKPANVEQSYRFTAQWTGGVGGKYDPEVVKALEDIKVGDSVKVKWMEDEMKRLLAIEKVSTDK